MKEVLLSIAGIIGAIALLVVIIEWFNQPSAAEINTIRQNLPQGCEFRDLGSYGDINHVVAVICEGRKVSTLSQVEQNGKYTRQGMSVTIDG